MLPTLCAGMRLVRYKKNVITDLWNIEKHGKGFAVQHRICTIAWQESLSPKMRSAGQKSIEDGQRRGYGDLVWTFFGWAVFSSVSDAYPRNHGLKRTMFAMKEAPWVETIWYLCNAMPLDVKWQLGLLIKARVRLQQMFWKEVCKTYDLRGQWAELLYVGSIHGYRGKWKGEIKSHLEGSMWVNRARGAARTLWRGQLPYAWF